MKPGRFHQNLQPPAETLPGSFWGGVWNTWGGKEEEERGLEEEWGWRRAVRRSWFKCKREQRVTNKISQCVISARAQHSAQQINTVHLCRRFSHFRGRFARAPPPRRTQVRPNHFCIFKLWLHPPALLFFPVKQPSPKLFLPTSLCDGIKEDRPPFWSGSACFLHGCIQTWARCAGLQRG